MKKLAILAALMPLALAQESCSTDGCWRAVASATRVSRGTERISTALADCNSYLLQTTTAPEATITATSGETTTTVFVTVTAAPAGQDPGEDDGPTAQNRKQKRQADSKPLPIYVQPYCADGAAYSSACKCYGAQDSTTTIYLSTTQITVPATVTTTITTTVGSDPSSTYNPTIPTDYSECYVNPATAEFELLDPATGIPFVNKNGLAALATSETDEAGTYSFEAPAGAPNGLFDIVVRTSAGKFYLAVFDNDQVGYTTVSSGGQDYVEREGKKFITSLFSIECSGIIRLGILGGQEWSLAVSPEGFLYAGIVDSEETGLEKRAIPVIYRILIFVVKIIFTPISPPPRCPNPATQLPYVKRGARPPSANGCGPAIVAGWIPPNLNFKSACDKHDFCFDDCKKGFDECNDAFLSDNYNICAAAYAGDAFLLWGCNKLAEVYTAAVRGPLGGLAFKSANSDRCDCCEQPKTICPENDYEICVDLLTDNQNCGACGNVCSEDSICENGACSDTKCTGQTCETFGPCGPGGSCVCASTSEGTGFCVDGSTLCAGLADCSSSASCGGGQICAVATCCGRPVCIGASFCGGFSQSLLFQNITPLSRNDRKKGTLARE